jgi:hypothetical protein
MPVRVSAERMVAPPEERIGWHGGPGCEEGRQPRRTRSADPVVAVGIGVGGNPTRTPCVSSMSPIPSRWLSAPAIAEA